MRFLTEIYIDRRDTGGKYAAPPSPPIVNVNEPSVPPVSTKPEDINYSKIKVS
jgi:hypothetical protein